KAIAQNEERPAVADHGNGASDRALLPLELAPPHGRPSPPSSRLTSSLLERTLSIGFLFRTEVRHDRDRRVLFRPWQPLFLCGAPAAPRDPPPHRRDRPPSHHAAGRRLPGDRQSQPSRQSREMAE